MKKKSIDWYTGFVDEAIRNDYELTTMYDELERMVRPEWKHKFEGLDDVMAIIDSTPSDAINSGAIALSGARPVFTVNPQAPNVQEYDRVQNMADLLMWLFRKGQRTGTGDVMFDMAWSSLLYNGIAVQVFDLKSVLPGNKALWSNQQKRAWRNGRFLFVPVNFKKIHWRESTIGLSAVIHVENFAAREVLEHWALFEDAKTEEGKQVAAGLKQLRDKLDAMEKSNVERRVMLYTVQDYENIVTFGRVTDSRETEDNASADFVLTHTENTKGFINYAFRVAGARLESKPEFRVNPLLAPLYWSGSWDKLNLAQSLIYSEPIRRAREPRGVSLTMSGQGVEVDRRNGNTINMRTGEDYKAFQPFTTDQGAMQIIEAMKAAMNRTTGASVIGDTTQVGGDMPFATYSAMLKVALSRLDRQRQALGDAVADIARMMLEWVEFNGYGISYNLANPKESLGTKTMLPAGTQMLLNKGGFDLDTLEMSCKILPESPADEQAQIAAAIQLSTQLNVPVSKLLEERLGFENTAVLYEQWAKEAVKTASIQAHIADLTAYAQTSGALRAQLEAQQAGQGEQMQAGGGGGEGGVAPPMGAGGGLSQAAFGQLGGNEFNPAAGGISPAQAQPGMMSDDAITGRTFDEEQINA